MIEIFQFKNLEILRKDNYVIDDRDSLILSVRTDYFVEIHEKITIEELINH
jgi:hypothetical protein